MEKKKKVIKYGIDEFGTLGVNAISLVDYPAIEDDFVALKAEEVKLAAVNDERRIVYGALLIPDKEILRIDAETQDEYYVVFPRDVIEAVAHKFMRTNSHHSATVMHEAAITGCVLVESWIKEGKEDKSIALGLTEQPDGTWYGGMKIDNDEMWAEVKEGNLRGFTIEGFFRDMSEQLSKESALLAEIEAILKQHTNQ